MADILRDTDYVMVNRGGVNYAATGAMVRQGKLQDTDLLMIQESGQLYQVSLGFLKSHEKDLINGATNFFIAERNNQLFSVENPFRRLAAPTFVCTLDKSGMAGDEIAFQVAVTGPTSVDGIPAQLLFLNDNDDEVLNAEYWGGSQDGGTLTVADANTYDVTKCLLIGSYTKVTFPNSKGLTTVKFTGATDSWARMFPNPSGFGNSLFLGCSKLTHVFGMSGYGDAPPAGILTNMDACFRGCDLFDGDISSWNTSAVTSMAGTFQNALLFNQSIDGWNVSKVTEFGRMFRNAPLFNKALNSWNVEAAKSFQGMFQDAVAFNKPLNNWNLVALNQDPVQGYVMNDMFNGASTMDEDLSGWCVSAIDTEPSGFRTGAPFTASNLPVWGTCP